MAKANKATNVNSNTAAVADVSTETVDKTATKEQQATVANAPTANAPTANAPTANAPVQNPVVPVEQTAPQIQNPANAALEVANPPVEEKKQNVTIVPPITPPQMPAQLPNVPVSVSGSKLAHEVIASVNRATVNVDRNIRMRKDSTVYGVTVTTDGYDVSTMIAQIFERGKIIEAIEVSEQADGSWMVLRGNRRALAGQTMLKLADLPEALRFELENTRFLVYRGLTVAEEQEKIMDQNSKPFSRSEIMRHAWNLCKSHKTFAQIGEDLFEMWGLFGRDKRTYNTFMKIRAMDPTDIEARRKEIKKWLRGTVDGYVIPAYEFGPQTQKAAMISEMHMDGLRSPDDEKPYFWTTKDTQERFIALNTAKNEDEKNGGWNYYFGGEKFNAKMKEFHDQDFPEDGAIVDKKKKDVRPSVTALKEFAKNAKSTVAKMVYLRAAGEVNTELEAKDDQLSLLEAKERFFLAQIEGIDPTLTGNVKQILTDCFLKEALDFKQMLEKFSLPKVSPETETAE